MRIIKHKHHLRTAIGQRALDDADGQRPILTRTVRINHNNQTLSATVAQQMIQPCRLSHPRPTNQAQPRPITTRHLRHARVHNTTK